MSTNGSSSHSPSPGPQRRRRRRRTTPGPGAYYPKLPMNAPMFSFGGKLSPSRGRDSSPGPGAYTVLNHSCAANDAPAFSLSGRIDAPRANRDSPGPGAYKHERAIDAPSFSFGGKLAALKGGTYLNPGPGTYTLGSMLSGPKFSLTSRDYRVGRKGTPGPGAYEPKNGITILKAPSYSLQGRTKMPNVHGRDVPGPGTYNVTPSPDGPFFSMGGRLDFDEYDEE